MARKTMQAQFEVKSLSEDGTFAGYGAVFGNVDAQREVIARGAFERTLQLAMGNGRMPALLWQHNTREPIGVWESMAEDQRGLYVEGRLAMETVRGAETHALLKMGALSGMSIGYEYVTYEDDRTTGIRTITDLDLFEVSVVTFPANDLARVSAVKDAFCRGEIPDIRTFESELREVFGLSQSQAKGLLARGWRALGSRREADDRDLESAARLVETLKRR